MSGYMTVAVLGIVLAKLKQRSRAMALNEWQAINEKVLKLLEEVLWTKSNKYAEIGSTNMNVLLKIDLDNN